ncbi:protein of unknown function [Corynebacterium mycetoides]|uniref:DUF4395 domain-containing protein n=1 Tax=Corynebacterium mycetoides TaxID=38302 RepID=A0A1G9LPP1_9CORY|nr:DUF4395 domain-containing protein [Corynebacterium mycetoides]SDL63455.1 protein of unknown function [Corynebacterium mycetoides]
MPFGEFPERVNEYASRTTAALVVALALTTIVAWLVAPALVALALNALLFAGFALRLYAGPKYSLFGQLSVRYLAGAAFGDPHIVSGAPKQFAQGIGVAFSLVALMFAATGHTVAGQVTLLMLVAAASAEAFLGFCAGCWIYRHGQKAGIISPDACETCAI